MDNCNPTKLKFYSVECVMSGIPTLNAEQRKVFMRVNADIIDEFIIDMNSKGYTTSVYFVS